VAVPIYDTAIQAQLRKIIDMLWADNTKARILGTEQNNEYRKINNKQKVRAQEATYNLLTPKKN
jgi:polyphosphate kinase